MRGSWRTGVGSRELMWLYRDWIFRKKGNWIVSMTHFIMGHEVGCVSCLSVLSMYVCVPA